MNRSLHCWESCPACLTNWPVEVSLSSMVDENKKLLELIKLDSQIISAQVS